MYFALRALYSGVASLFRCRQRWEQACCWGVIFTNHFPHGPVLCGNGAEHRCGKFPYGAISMMTASAAHAWRSPLARACWSQGIAKGFRISHIPQPLYWSGRMSNQSAFGADPSAPPTASVNGNRRKSCLILSHRFSMSSLSISRRLRSARPPRNFTNQPFDSM